MSALTVYLGLEERFKTVADLRNIILGEPTAAHDLPCLYTAFEGFDRVLGGLPPADNLTGMTYRFVHRLLIRWQDRSEAEEELLHFINSIPAAVDAEPTLGGRITRGNARISEGLAGFQMVGDTKYRAIDFFSTVLEKAPRSAGL